MILHFYAADRKQMVKIIEEALGIKAKYLKVPSLAYQIGAFRVSKEGNLEFDEGVDDIGTVTDALLVAGFKAEEYIDDNDVLPDEPSTDSLIIEMPRKQLTDAAIENLKKIIESKAGLFRQAFGVEELPVMVSDEKVSFPWFKQADSISARAYAHFISALCEMAANQKRITATEKEVDNAKYAFRCFLLRLGFIGEEYKAERKALLKNLSGSSAFKSGKKGGAE